MERPSIKNIALLAASLAWAALGFDCSVRASPAALPDFTHRAPAEWINTAPLTIESLRGRVILVEFWAFDCINCLHSAAWVGSMAEKYRAAGLVVIGVHTPELPEERVPSKVRDAVKRLAIQYPVMIDGDYSFWNAMNNRYWPAFYVIGADGRIRAQDIGEMHSGETAARQLESTISDLLATAR